MKILHISHHIGCMRDHAYIYNKLGFEFEFWKFPKGLFYITRDVANSIWNERKEYFNKFDYIVTSDTAPLSRIFMENIDELKPKIIVWICNRFDYNMERDMSFYQIFNKIANENKDKFKIIPYSDFEKVWCNIRGIKDILNTITPIGINPIELDSTIDCLNDLQNSYTEDPNAKNSYKTATELEGKIFIPIYGNDNIFYNLKEILTNNNIQVFNGGYKHSTDLKYCKGLVTFPDAFSKLITFETIQNEVIVFLPSIEYLIKLHPTINNNTKYWFNCPVGYLNIDLIRYCEWYRYDKCRIYFDSINDLIYKITNLTEEIIEEKRKWCRIYGSEIEANNINLWKQILI